MTFIKVWLGYAILGATIYAIGFAWAVRQRQFTDLEAARHIALKLETLSEDDTAKSDPPRKADIVGLAGILLTAVAVIAAVLILGWKHRGA